MKSKKSKSKTSKATTVTEPPLPELGEVGDINDSEWSCVVIMVVEYSKESFHYTTSLENCLKQNTHRIVKHINLSNLEGNKKPQKSTKSKVKSQFSSSQYGLFNTKELCDKIKRVIYFHKLEDLALRNSAKEGIKIEMPNQGDHLRANVNSGPLYGPSMYFVLIGFYDPYLPFELISEKVPLQAIIRLECISNESRTKLSERYTLKGGQTSEGSEMSFRQFWATYHHLNEMNPDLNRLTVNVPVMRLNPKQEMTSFPVDDSEKDLEIYTTFVNYLFSIQKQYRHYLHQMELTKLIKVEEIERSISVTDIEPYLESMQSIPIENASVQIILYHLLDAVEALDNTQWEFVGDYSIKYQNPEKLGCTRNDTPQIFNYRDNFTKEIFNLQIDQQKYHKFYLNNILNGMPFTKIWKFFPELKPLEYAWLKSHYQKMWRFMREQVKENIMEITLHKVFFNKVTTYLSDEEKNYFIIQHVPDLKLNSNFEFCFQNLFSIDTPLGPANGLNNLSLLTMFEKTDSDSYRNEEFMSRNDEEASDYWTSQSLSMSMNSTAMVSSYSELFSQSPIGSLTNTEVAQMGDNEASSLQSEQGTEILIEDFNPFDKNNRTMKRTKALAGLKLFLDFPEFDGLFTEQISGFKDQLSDYNVVEVLKKYSCLQTIEKYFSEFHFLDYIHYKTTDSLLLIFHNRLDKNGISKYNTKGSLNTAVGFRDYSYFVRKEVEKWLVSQDEIIEEKDKILLESKGITYERSASNCCLETIRKQGLFSKPEERIYYQNHLPFPDVKLADNEESSKFFCYDLGPSRVQYEEATKLFYTVAGKEVTFKICSWINSHIKEMSLKVVSCENTLMYHYRIGEEGKDYNSISLKTFNKTRITFINHMVIDPDKKLKEATKESIFKINNHMTYSSGNEINELIITTANGLEISLVKIEDGSICIKQRFLSRELAGCPVKDEKYRLFLKNGTVLIYKEDGTTVVLYPNSTKVTIHHVARDFVDEVIQVEPSVENISKKSTEKKNKKSKLPPEEPKPTFISRRRNFFVMGKHEVVSWSGLKREFVYDFCKRSNYEYKVRGAYDGVSELFVTRNDGTKTLLSNDGLLQVQYSDGTRISTLPHFENAYVNQSDITIEDPQEGIEQVKHEDSIFLVVEMEVLMEHPHYATVQFSEDGEWTIALPGEIYVKFYSDKLIAVKISDELKVDMVHTAKAMVSRRTNDLGRVISESFIYLNDFTQDHLFTHRDVGAYYMIDSHGRVKYLDRMSDNLSRTRKFELEDSHLYSREEIVSQRTDCVSIANYKVPLLFRLFVLKRDLSGYELLHDSENETIEMKASEVFTDECNKFQPHWCEDGPETTSQYPLASVLSETFQMAYRRGSMVPVNLKRYQLSIPISKNVVWLFGLRRPQKSKSTSNLSELYQPMAHHSHTPCKAMMIRKVIKFSREYSTMFHEALEAYVGFKSVTFALFQKNLSIPPISEEEAEMKYNVLINAIAAMKRG